MYTPTAATQHSYDLLRTLRPTLTPSDLAAIYGALAVPVLEDGYLRGRREENRTASGAAERERYPRFA